MDVIELPNGRKIGPGQPCFIVAEIGQNHQGNVYTALRLIKEAHEAGVDAVKLCKRHIPSDMTRELYYQPYDNPNSFGATYGKHREALELSIGEYAHLKERMRYNEWPEILFATACDIQSADALENWLDPPLYKIASRDLDNLPLIEHVARFGKPVILSTGFLGNGISEGSLREALGAVRAYAPVAILYCISQYPTPIESIDLRTLKHLEEYGKCPVGFSDHTAGIVAAQTAAIAGAVIIEKHITLARAMKGTDHAASLEPDGLRRLVRNIRLGEQMLTRTYAPSETAEWRKTIWQTRMKLGRSLVTTQSIAAGRIITESMLCLKSPGNGIRWDERHRVIGKQVRVTIPVNTTLQWADIQESRKAELPMGVE